MLLNYKYLYIVPFEFPDLIQNQLLDEDSLDICYDLDIYSMDFFISYICAEERLTHREKWLKRDLSDPKNEVLSLLDSLLYIDLKMMSPLPDSVIQQFQPQFDFFKACYSFAELHFLPRPQDKAHAFFLESFPNLDTFLKTVLSYPLKLFIRSSELSAEEAVSCWQEGMDILDHLYGLVQTDMQEEGLPDMDKFTSLMEVMYARIKKYFLVARASCLFSHYKDDPYLVTQLDSFFNGLLDLASFEVKKLVRTCGITCSNYLYYADTFPCAELASLYAKKKMHRKGKNAAQLFQELFRLMKPYYNYCYLLMGTSQEERNLLARFRVPYVVSHFSLAPVLHLHGTRKWAGRKALTLSHWIYDCHVIPLVQNQIRWAQETHQAIDWSQLFHVPYTHELQHDARLSKRMDDTTASLRSKLLDFIHSVKMDTYAEAFARELDGPQRRLPEVNYPRTTNLFGHDVLLLDCGDSTTIFLHHLFIDYYLYAFTRFVLIALESHSSFSHSGRVRLNHSSFAENFFHKLRLSVHSDKPVLFTREDVLEPDALLGAAAPSEEEKAAVLAWFKKLLAFSGAKNITTNF